VLGDRSGQQPLNPVVAQGLLLGKDRPRRDRPGAKQTFGRLIAVGTLYLEQGITSRN
jgi:hypothetical protein